MPSQTFFNLPKEKKEALLQSARKEFSRVPLNEASINKIIKQANIARGSFYQYFENKEELYFYLLHTYREKSIKKIEYLIKEHHGDLIETFIALYDFIIVRSKKQENQSFFKHLFLNMNFKMDQEWLKQENQCPYFSILDQLFPLIDQSKLRITKQEDLREILFVLILVLSKNLVRYFISNGNIEESRAQYLKQLNLLTYGIYK